MSDVLPLRRRVDVLPAPGRDDGASGRHAVGQTETLRDRIRRELFYAHPELLSRAASDALARGRIREAAMQAARAAGAGTETMERLAAEVLADVAGFGILQPLIDDPAVTEVLVNGPGQVWVERAGRLERTEVRFEGMEDALHLVKRLASGAGREFSEAEPLVLLTLDGGVRVRAVREPATRQGIAISIRKPARPENPIGPREMVASGSLTEEMLSFLDAAVRAKLNIFVLGGTGSGKTTLIRVMMHLVPPEERMVVVEAASELVTWDRDRHLVNLEAVERPQHPVPIRELFRAALQMRPDRFILGEATGVEAADVIEAMSAAFPGGITSFHAETPQDMVRRLTLLILQAGYRLREETIRDWIHQTLNLVVSCRRLPDGRRVVESITEVLPEGFCDLWRYETRLGPDGAAGEHRRAGALSHAAVETAARRWVDLSPWGKAP